MTEVRERCKREQKGMIRNCALCEGYVDKEGSSVYNECNLRYKGGI